MEMPDRNSPSALAPPPQDDAGGVQGAAVPFRLWTQEERHASMENALKHWREDQDV